MKTIVVPTDFSASAENAMFYAGQLAQTIQASILLLHVYQIPVSMNDVQVLMISVEELKSNADAGLEKAKAVLQKQYPAIIIKTESRLGDIADELNDVCKGLEIFAAVVGKHGHGGIERFLFGSTALSVIRHSKVPVVAVPVSAINYQIKNIALAVDTLTSDAQQKIKTIAEELKTRLQIFHIITGKPGSETLSPQPPDLPFHTITDTEFAHGIQTYVQANQIDLLVIFPHKHNLIERLFLKTHTPELLDKLSIPLMCINEK